MRILFVTPEAVPFAKTGGLADVAGALPKALRALGQEVAIILPCYRQAREKHASRIADAGIQFPVELDTQTHPAAILRSVLPGTDVPVYLVDHPEFFGREALYGTPAGDYPDNAERFVFFAKAVLQATKALNWGPAIYHCNDWQSALVPVYLQTTLAQDSFYHNSRSLLTIHNLAYQGVFPPEAFPLTGLDPSHFNWRELEFYGKLNLLKGGIVHADLLSTVSQRYAQEIQTEEWGCGLEGVLASKADRLRGIVNGIDYSVWNPAADELIPAQYSPQDLSGKAACKRALQQASRLPVRDVPLLGLISRLDNQKGLDLVAAIAEDLAKLAVQFVLLGTGLQEYHDLFAALGRNHPEKFGIHLTFNNPLAHQIEAGADMYLMPSRYEPCGLNQLYSLKYGTVPIVRKTGGLADTIVNCTPTSLAKGTANGFSFESYSHRALLNTIKRALRVYADRRAWRRLVLAGMRQDWSWEKSARQYLELYKMAARG
jgi:starch synthase